MNKLINHLSINLSFINLAMYMQITEQETRQIIVQCGVRILVLSVTLRNAIYCVASVETQSTVACIYEGRNGVRWRKEEINQGTSAVIPSSKGGFLEAATTRG